jgi:hypothetical protein
MEDSQLGKMADVMRIITGKWHGECGEKAYRRVIKEKHCGSNVTRDYTACMQPV